MSIDLKTSRIALRDRKTADVLDLALRFVVVNARLFAKVSLVSIVPLGLAAIAAGVVLGWRTAWLVALPLAIVAEVPFTVLASRLVFEEEVRARDVIFASIKQGAPVVLMRLLGLALTALGLGVCAVPGVWLAAIFLFLGEVMLLEGGGIARSFGRAQNVAGSASSEVVLALIVLSLIPPGSVVLADVAGRAIIGELLQFRPPRSAWGEGGSVLATAGLFLQVPYLATARFFLYLNVRTHTEGWDIQTRFAAIAARARGSS